jgi:hypothetical protein
VHPNLTCHHLHILNLVIICLTSFSSRMRHTDFATVVCTFPALMSSVLAALSLLPLHPHHRVCHFDLACCPSPRPCHHLVAPTHPQPRGHPYRANTT